MAVGHARVSVGTAAVLVAGAPDDFDGASFLVRNRGSVSVFLGAADVTTATGFELEAGEALPVDLERNEELYAISGTPAQEVHVLRSGA